jgi:hypothetical protein
MALAFFLLGFSLGQIAVALEYGGWTWVLAWPAQASLWLSLAYFAHRPGVLGKRASGTIAAWAWPLFVPYFAFAWLLWRTHRLISREDAWNEVAPGLFLGRRVEGRELPDVPAVVDMTAEFVEPRSIRRLPGYHCLATLDANAPDERRFLDLVDQLATTPRLFIHCAQGHGRSATLAAALLMRRGLASSAHDAEAQLKAKRPAVSLKRVQRDFLDRLRARLLPP